MTAAKRKPRAANPSPHIPPDALLSALIERSTIMTVKGQTYLVIEPEPDLLDELSAFGSEGEDLEDEPDCCDAADDDLTRKFNIFSAGDDVDHEVGVPMVGSIGRMMP